MKSVSSLFTQPRNLLVLLHDTAMAFVAVGVAFYLRLGAAMFDRLDTVLECPSAAGIQSGGGGSSSGGRSGGFSAA